MGNQHQKRGGRDFSLSEWEFVERQSNYGLFRNRINGLHCEEYLLKVGREKQKAAYQRRKARRQEHLVNILHCEVFTNFSERYVLIDYTVRVFLERIPVRLQEIAQLPADAIPVVMFDCLLGFKKICEEHQPLHVTSEMIGFNQNKEVKVWLSKNFLQNFPPTLSTTASEQSMVEDIFSIFDRYSDLYSERQQIMTFTEALQFIAQIKPINKAQITLIKIPSDAPVTKPQMVKSAFTLKNKLSMGPKDRKELSPPPKKIAFSKPSMAPSVCQIKPATDEESDDQCRFVVHSANSTSTIKQSNSSSMYIPSQQSFANQRRQPVHGINQPKGYHLRTDTEIKKNTTVTGLLSKQTKGAQKSMAIGIESARTTSNNMSVYDNMIELDDKSLQLELLDDKKTKEAKLGLIQNVLEDNHDEYVRKVCKVYNYAIKHDPLMYHQLQKAQGRISKISNEYVIKKLIQISEQQPNNSQTSVQMSSCVSEPWMKVKKDVTNTSFVRKDSDQRIRQILRQERIKRGEDPDTRVSDKNLSFFKDVQQSPQLKHQRSGTSLNPNLTFQKPRKSEAMCQLEAILEDNRGRRATATQKKDEPKPPQDKVVQKKTLEAFKQEVNKLFE